MIRSAGSGSRGHRPCRCGDWLPRVRCTRPGPTSEGGGVPPPHPLSLPQAGGGVAEGQVCPPFPPSLGPWSCCSRLPAPPSCGKDVFKPGSGFFGGIMTQTFARSPSPVDLTPLASSPLLAHLLQPSRLPPPALERQLLPSLCPLPSLPFPSSSPLSSLLAPADLSRPSWRWLKVPLGASSNLMHLPLLRTRRPPYGSCWPASPQPRTVHLRMPPPPHKERGPQYALTASV